MCDKWHYFKILKESTLVDYFSKNIFEKLTDWFVIFL